MSLDLAQINRSGPQHATDAQKTAALALWLTELLALHAPTTGAWKTVATYADPRLRQHIGRGDRVDVMGDPARYAEVILTGRVDGYGPTAPAHVYEVAVYYGTGTDPSSASFTSELAAAHAAFRVLCDDDSETVPGILRAADRQASLATADGSRCLMGDPQGTTYGRLPGTPADETLALQFTITVS